MSEATQDHDGIEPPTSAGQLLSRLSELIVSAQTMRDLDHRTVGRALGLDVDDDHRLNHSAQLTAEWHYSVLADPGSPLGPVLLVEFSDSSGAAVADMTDICEVDLDEFGAGLTAAGFVSEDESGEHGELISQTFTREPFVVCVVSRGEADSPPDKVTHACIQSVTVP